MVIAASLTFALPAYEPKAGTCNDYTIVPEHDTLTVVVERMRSTEQKFTTYQALGGFLPGSNATVPVDTVSCRPCSYRVVLRDKSGNTSCPSNAVSVWSGVPPVSVPPPPTIKRELFDLAGRRLTEPVGSGIYFERVLSPSGHYRKRMVVIR